MQWSPASMCTVLLYQTLNYNEWNPAQGASLCIVSRFLSLIILKCWAHSFHPHPEGCVTLIQLQIMQLHASLEVI